MANDPDPRRRQAKGVRPCLVLLVRHGVTPTTGKVLPGRARGLHLADAGREQARAVGERLAGWSSRQSSREPKGEPGPKGKHGSQGPGVSAISAIYSSPLERTRETAALIAEALGLGVVADRGLLECDYGEWTGKRLDRLVKLPEWTTVQRFPSGFRFPGGESFAAMQARIGDAVQSLVARHAGGTIVVVSHADPIKAVVAGALGTHLDLFQRISISPCSTSAIEYSPAAPRVLGVNATAFPEDQWEGRPR